MNRKQGPVWGKKTIIVLLVGLALTSASLAQAQQQAKIAKLGFLGSEYLSENIDALRQGLHNLGYVEGQNLVIKFRYAKGKIERLPELADELVRLKVDVIVVTGSTPGALAAKNASMTIPIVFLGTTNPVTTGPLPSPPSLYFQLKRQSIDPTILYVIIDYAIGGGETR